MPNPFDNLKVLKNWKPGDTRQVSERELRRLRTTDAWDSYSSTYRLDGLVWRVVSEMAQADGQTIITLEASSE